MDTNHKLKEDAALHALDLLDATEKAYFEKALRRDEILAEEHQQMEDAIAAVALTAPPQPAPDLLGEIHGKLGHVTGQSSRPSWPGKALHYGGWPIAACLAVSILWLTQHTRSLQRELTQFRKGTEIQPVAPPSGNGEWSVNNVGNALTDSEREALERVTSILQSGHGAEGRPLPSEGVRLLRDRLERYQRLHNSRFDPVPGLARWVVTEMRDPEDEDSVSSTRVFDAQDIATVMASAIDSAAAAPEEGAGKPIVLEGGDVRWNGEVKVVNGLLDLDRFNFDDDVVIVQENFPEENWKDVPGLEQIGDGQFYHEDSDFLYQRGADGSYVATRPPADFNPDDPGNLSAPTDTKAKEVLPSPAQATTFFNEVTGDGSLYVRGLTPLDKGTNYHLWLRDAESQRMISVGPLPPSTDGSELIDFPHGLHGTSPAEYLLTRETSPEPSTPNQSETVLVWP